MNQDIAKLVGSCEKCNTYVNSQRPEPMYERIIPSEPWEALACDLFYLKKDTYLILADYFSKFVIIRKIHKETTQAVAQQLKSIFSEHGIPRNLYSDNGPCFASQEFRDFTHKLDIQHITSSPGYPQSNGFIERMVQTVKNTLKKGEDPDIALLYLRSTPISPHLPTPAELLFNRKIRNLLPLISRTERNVSNKDALKRQQTTAKEYYDRKARPLSELHPGESVMLQDKNLEWKAATVVSKSKEPRSYNVQDTEGNRLRRNRRFLRPLSTTVLHTANNPISTELPTADSSTTTEQPTADNQSSDINELPTADRSLTDARHSVSFSTTDRPTRQTRAPRRLITEM